MGNRKILLIDCLTGVIITAMLLASGCSADDCFHGTGSSRTETRSLSTFLRIDLSDDIDLIIVPGSNRSEVRISGGEHLLDQIETRVESGTLYLRNNNSCNWVRSFKHTITAEVYCDSLTAVWIEDAVGDVRMADTVRTNEFRLDSYSSMGDYQLKIECNTVTLAVHNGPSNLTAAGHCQNQYNYQTGYGKIDCSQLQSAFVFLTNNGSNDSYVNAKKLLEAKLGHTGNVYYTGQPDSIRSSISGSGRLISF